VFSLTICIDTSKAIWNWYLQLFLLNQGVFVVDLGVIKSSSLIAKASLQLVIPALEDSGGLVAFSPVSAQVCAHFLDVLAVILTVPIVMTFESFCQLDNIKTIITLKSLVSILSIFVGLADGIVARTVQSSKLKYSSIQCVHVMAWCGAMVVGGFLVDLYGFSIIFPLTAGAKVLGSYCMARLAYLCPLPRLNTGNVEATAWVRVK